MKRVTGQLFDAERIADDGELVLVSKATSLGVSDTVVRATIPLASADSYDITLPPVSSAPGVRYYIEFVVATGTYVDGTVTVKGRGDEVGGAFASGSVATTNDFLVIDNIAGRRWAETASKVTAGGS